MDEAEFHAFYTTTAGPLRSYLVSCVRDVSTAEDMMQEAYFRLLRSGFVTDDARYRKNYLFRIATNLVRDAHRQRRPLVELLVGDVSQPSHEDKVLLRSDLSSTLQQLKPRERQMLWLAYVEGLTHHEIAEILGLKAASMRSMLFRARQRLVQQMKHAGLVPDGQEESTS